MQGAEGLKAATNQAFRTGLQLCDPTFTVAEAERVGAGDGALPLGLGGVYWTSWWRELAFGYCFWMPPVGSTG